MTMPESPDAHSPVVPVIPRNRAPGGRDIVVGDVHGCFRTLERALGEIVFEPARDRLFGVGDLVNRGPHSADALKWLESRFEAVTLGNHDVAVRSWFRSKLLNAPEEAEGWLCAILPSDYRRWWDALASLPPALTIETDHGPIGVVHAEAPDRIGTVPSSSLRPAWTRRTASRSWGTRREKTKTLRGLVL